MKDEKESIKRVITYGTFDMFHIGHLNLLKRAKDLGDELYVAVSSDEFNKIKGKDVVIPYYQRASIVESIKYVTKVITEENWDQKVTDIQKNNIDVLVMGDDWRGKFDFLEEYCEVVYLPRTQDISSAHLKKSLKSLAELLQQMVRNMS